MAFMDLEKDLFKKRISELTGDRGAKIESSRSARNAMNQRMAGGAGMGAGAAATGAAVQSGVGNPLEKTNEVLPSSPITDMQTIGNRARLGDTTDQILRSTPEVTPMGPTFADANEPRQQESTRFGATNIGPGAFTDENYKPKNTGAFSVVETPDREGAIAALQDLRDYKNKTGAYEQKDRPVTVIGGYKSYQDDLASYSSGDVGSEGYTRIRNERMQLQSQLDNALRGVSGNKAKAAITESILGKYSELQKARIAGETDQANAAMELAGDQAEAQADYGAATLEAQQKAQEAAMEQDYQNRDLLQKQRDSEARRATESQRLGIDAARLQMDAETNASRYGEGGLESQRVMLDAMAKGDEAQYRQQENFVKKAKLAQEANVNQLGEIDPEFRDRLMNMLFPQQ
jgi:hypothetical protein